jgi:hypothetical protein
MSRENRVNPGAYTQAGRLTPDDAAREMAKQRQPGSNGHDKNNPKSRASAWMNQAQQARARAGTPAVTSSGWVDRLGGSLALIGVAFGTVCLSLYLMRRRSAARAISDQVPATNHTPGRPYAYGI